MATQELQNVINRQNQLITKREDYYTFSTIVLIMKESVQNQVKFGRSSVTENLGKLLHIK